MREKRRPGELQRTGARRETEDAGTIARPTGAVGPARDDAAGEAQLLALAAAADWRERIADLRLPAREARELRIRVLGARVFHAGTITSRARAGRLAKKARTSA